MPDMATYHAISATGKSIVGLLSENCPKPEFTGAEFKLRRPSDFRQSKRLQFGISICLCRVNVNTVQRIPVQPTAPDGQRQRPPLALDLYFLMTVWAKTPERQHDLLGWAMCFLNDNPVLPASVLNRFAGGTNEVFGPEESVQLVAETLDFEQMNAVCELVQIRQQPSIIYVARPVTIQRPSSQSVIVGREDARIFRGKSSRRKPGA